MEAILKKFWIQFFKKYYFYFTFNQKLNFVCFISLTSLKVIFHLQYGQVTCLISSRKKGSAIIEFRTTEAAVCIIYSIYE